MEVPRITELLGTKKIEEEEDEEKIGKRQVQRLLALRVLVQADIKFLRKDSDQKDPSVKIL